MERNVLHINVANFIATVEELCDSTLRGEPFIVANRYAPRAVILDVSDKAFKEGLRRGMPLKMVQRMKGIPIIEPRYDRYQEAERELFKLVFSAAPVIEQVAGGHLFLDISGTKKYSETP